MLARLRKAVEENDEGFTLIELLVVMIIIGILAAIAIPVFLNQRKKAVDSSMKSDLRTVATAMETAFVDDQTYASQFATANGGYTVGGEAVEVSNGNVIAVQSNNNEFCIVATRASGASASSQGDGGATTGWVYDSRAGGLQPATVTACNPAIGGGGTNP